MQLHSRSLIFTRRRHQQSVRNRHEVISISHSCNEHTTPPRLISFLKPPLHASPTSRNHHTVIAISHSCNEHIITLHTISFLNNHLHSSSTAAISTQLARSHLDLVLTQPAYNTTSCNFIPEASSPRITDIAQSPLNPLGLSHTQ